MNTWVPRSYTPPENRNLIAYCPEWNDSGYQICKFSRGIFSYDEQPNDLFHDCVLEWSLFVESE